MSPIGASTPFLQTVCFDDDILKFSLIPEFGKQRCFLKDVHSQYLLLSHLKLTHHLAGCEGAGVLQAI